MKKIDFFVGNEKQRVVNNVLVTANYIYWSNASYKAVDGQAAMVHASSSHSGLCFLRV